MLILSRKLNEKIIINDTIEVSVVEIKGDHIKLGILAPKSVKVYRHEVYEAIQSENKAAAKAPSDLGSLADFFTPPTEKKS
jgi:carbon storage regulator